MPVSCTMRRGCPYALRDSTSPWRPPMRSKTRSSSPADGLSVNVSQCPPIVCVRSSSGIGILQADPEHRVHLFARGVRPAAIVGVVPPTALVVVHQGPQQSGDLIGVHAP